MPNTPKVDRDLADLIERWQLGNLDEIAREKLVARLEGDPSARRAFIDAARFEALLHLEFPDSVVHIPQVRRPWHKRPATWLAAAAAVILAGAITLMRPPSPSGGSVASGGGETPSGTVADGEEPRPSTLLDTTPVARVHSLSDAVLASKSVPLEEGALLQPGTIQLKSGQAELTFFSGARVTLKGPCVFRLKSDFRATLSRGCLTAEVPPQAIGFTIHTPTGQLRDLGTSFAVNVTSDGVSDVHVLDGQVEASPRDASSIVTLGVNQASRISRGKLVPIQFIADGWPEKSLHDDGGQLPSSVHWSFDRFEGDETLDANEVHPLWLRGSPGKNGHYSGRLQRGIKGQALSFNGVDQFAESTYRGVPGNKSRSVSLWVRIPPDASYRYPNGIVSWGTHKQSRKWQVCWNNGDQGTVGALRVEFGDGYLIGTTDLRDGLWHHLGVVFLGGGGSDVASHVKLYVDGRLETLSGRRSQFIRTDTESPQAIAVTLGRWLGNWPGKEPFYFRGAVDEVRIFEEALSPSQIAELARQDD
ncbi:MAG: FecR domain-containing protein [Akkermansiaceae bacterium]|nr:FecR domain-containing protein [Akkermansiaceae bacterium]MCP5545602.1 FecR domain-containing protein [Akkermansiaceae bacterium]MCP5545810.1 FecR domain-containing protein [Akkermansiaceae bacterium]